MRGTDLTGTVDTVDQPVPRPFGQWLSTRDLVAIDAVLAVLFALGSFGAVVTGRHGGPSGVLWNPLRIVCILVACGVLPFRRRNPRGVLATATPPVALLAAIGVRGPVQLVVALAMYTVASTSAQRAGLATVGPVVGGLALGAIAAAGGPRWGEAVSGPAVVLVGWLAGENIRARRAYARGVAERAVERDRDREERMRRAAADERVRIARELHDVVAHTMSVIAVRSGVARMVLETQPDEARKALEIIETTSRRALQEMRRIVGVLRRDEETAAELVPAPGLADLGALVKQIREAGVQVVTHVEGHVRPLPPGIDVSAYRIVQEALTNVVRHAGRAVADVRIRYQADAVEIEVHDDGGERARGGPTPLPPDQGGGHGLVGMRERVALYGGELLVEAAPPGFRVLARLPTDGD